MSWQRNKSFIAAMSEDRIRVLNIEKFGPGAAAHGTLKAGFIEYERTPGLDETNRPDYHDPETKRILRKVDWRLPPVLALLYLLSFLDRSNIGNARIAGMTEDLNITGQQFNIALTVFFFPYALFMLPSNMVLKKLKASTWLAILVTSWGTVMTMHGVVQNYGKLCAVRTLLGLTESGFTPAAQYLLSCWYARFEYQTRIALFFSAATLAGAFSGLLAYAIEKMHGTGGYEGWRWIFILEGLFTVAIGMSVKFILPDSPRECTFLTPAEKTTLERRIFEDAGTQEGSNDHNDVLSLHAFLSIFTDWKIWLWGMIVCGQSIPYYAFSFTAPTIVKELGYKSWQAQLLVVPIYLLACIATVVVGLVADRRQKRWIYIVVPYSLAVVAFVALLVIPHPKWPGLTYGFLFLIPLGLSTANSSVLSWVANNLAPSWRKAMGIAWVSCLTNLGGSIGSNIYIAKEAPRYWTGFGFSLGVLLAAISAVLTLRFALVRINRKRDAMDVEEIRARYSEEELLAMGDKSPLYRYVI